MNNPLFGRDVVSIGDLSKADIEFIIERATTLKRSGPQPLLKDRLIASCFFEASTRTRLSFETAVQRLGGTLIGFSDSATPRPRKAKPCRTAFA